eukprot:snap_masked-scaffold_67-processed-gene-0.72-mRNA-1 protein AED:1.00 eAED:1.00 QI:0/0/0/0/1/1/2/0/403
MSAAMEDNVHVQEGIKIFTYNVLAEPERTPSVKPRYIVHSFNDDTIKYAEETNESKERWEKLEPKLKPRIDKGQNYIICLQEVTRLWNERLTNLLEAKGYTCHFMQYGPENMGFYGVFIGVPEIYTIEDIAKTMIAETVCTPSEDNYDNQTLRFYNNQIFKDTITAFEKRNFCIWLHLKHGGRDFCVATYHVPRGTEKVKQIHIGLFLRFVQRLSGEFPLVVAGDFNIEPNTDTYNMITTGDWNRGEPLDYLLSQEKNTDLIKNKWGDLFRDDKEVYLSVNKDIRCCFYKAREEANNNMTDVAYRVHQLTEDKIIHKMTSVYAQYGGKLSGMKNGEPYFTQMPKYDPSRATTLDYIFHRNFKSAINLRNPGDLYKSDDKEEARSNLLETQLKEPSDHIFLELP